MKLDENVFLDAAEILYINPYSNHAYYNLQYDIEYDIRENYREYQDFLIKYFKPSGCNDKEFWYITALRKIECTDSELKTARSLALLFCAEMIKETKGEV